MTGPDKSDLIKCVEIGGGEVFRSQPRPGNDPNLRIICDDEELSAQVLILISYPLCYYSAIIFYFINYFFLLS